MNEEQYVTFKVAKLLKEKGFDWVVDTYYCDDYNYVQHDIIEYRKENYNSHNVHISAPTQQMVCRWLREVHKIHITTEPLEMFKQERIVYEPIIYLLNDFDDFALEYKTVHLKECDTNEEAVEAALEYTLRNLI